jgi:hypothetical protein
MFKKLIIIARFVNIRFQQVVHQKSFQFDSIIYEDEDRKELVKCKSSIGILKRKGKKKPIIGKQA